MTNNLGQVIIGMIFVGFALGVIFSTQEGKRFMDQAIFHMPLVGKVTQYYDMVKFMRYMRLLMQA